MQVLPKPSYLFVLIKLISAASLSCDGSLPLACVAVFDLQKNKRKGEQIKKKKKTFEETLYL